MAVVRSIIGDIALVAVLAAFIDMFLPRAREHYGIKLVFGLYFLAILLNPIVVFFTDADFGDLDFREVSLEQYENQDENVEGSVLTEAAASLSLEIEAKLEAVYESVDFTVEMTLSPDEVDKMEIRAEGAEPGRQRVIDDEIKTMLAGDYGVERKKIKVVFT